MNYGFKKLNINQITVILLAVVNDHSIVTSTTRTCIEYDYMHIRTLHYATNYAVFNMIGSRYNQIEY